MTENERQRLRTDAIVAFMTVVSAAVVVHDETSKGSASTEEFLETLDLVLKLRLDKPDGPRLAAPVRTLFDQFTLMVKREKSQFVMKRAIDEIFDDIDDDGGI